MSRINKEHKCRHFTGILHKTCELGIEYDSLKDRSADSGYKLICCEADSRLPCASFQPYTAKEISEQDRIAAERLNFLLAAMTKIKEKEGNRRGVRGTIDCPQCGGTETLHYTISAYNGHVCGKCETEGCLGWMQ